MKGFNFDMAAMLTDRVMQMEEDFDNVVVIYNKFNSVVSFTVTEMNMDSYPQLSKREELDKYEFEDEAKDDHVQDFFEFQLSTLLFHAISENATSELGARMGAMDSASKNAKEMYKTLNTSYNRARQAAITTELTEVKLQYHPFGNTLFADYLWCCCCRRSINLMHVILLWKKQSNIDWILASMV